MTASKMKKKTFRLTNFRTKCFTGGPVSKLKACQRSRRQRRLEKSRHKVYLKTFLKTSKSFFLFGKCRRGEDDTFIQNCFVRSRLQLLSQVFGRFRPALAAATSGPPTATPFSFLSMLARWNFYELSIFFSNEKARSVTPLAQANKIQARTEK